MKVILSDERKSSRLEMETQEEADAYELGLIDALKSNYFNDKVLIKSLILYYQRILFKYLNEEQKNKIESWRDAAKE